MSDERLLAAAERLQAHYGRLDLDEYRGTWAGLTRFILERLISKPKFAKAWPEISTGWLMSVDEVARGSRAELLEYLKPHGGSATTVALLHRLAVWWQRKLDAGCSPLEPEQSNRETDWAELSAHDSIWITRVFCVIGGLQRFPVTRAAWRVACRHRWLAWHDDPCEAPAFFEQGTADSSFELGQLAEWLIRVGDDYCGPTPKCSGCPLQPLLGPNGICEPED